MKARSKYKSFFWRNTVAFVLLSSAALADAVKDVAEDPVEIFARAELAMNRQDVKDAFDLLRKSAGLNYTPAQVYLGEYLDTIDSDDEAVGWFMTAAYQGNTAGAFGLAKMYAAGEGVEQSSDKAMFWFRFAAEKNHTGAVRVLANAYKKGLMGQKINLEQAKIWGDKIPALEAAEHREHTRRVQIAKKAADEAAKKRKSDQEDLTKKFLEAKELEDTAAEEKSTVKGGNEAGQGQIK